ncbi:MAG: prolyl oligopeptidase family serine peptidase [Actinobacteria bacterium]|nr:prolyl oligopeptidase family serine peptidase [Actinomycetota bacterium]
MSRARLILDLLGRPRTIRYGSDASQRADLHLPDGPGPHPVVVAIHGGSWESTYGRIIMRGLAAELARRGWAAWNIEYRRLGRGGGWPASFEDVAAAVDHLCVLDAPIDLGRVAGLGHSAGGQLVLWAAGRYKLPPWAPGAGPRVRFAAAISQAGVIDLGSAHARDPHGPVDALMGGSPAAFPDRFALGDPTRQVPLDIPVLLVHGTDDPTVSVERSRAYAAASRRAGGSVELVEIPGEAGRHRGHIDPAGRSFGIALAWLGRTLPPERRRQ